MGTERLEGFMLMWRIKCYAVKERKDSTSKFPSKTLFLSNSNRSWLSSFGSNSTTIFPFG